MGDAKTADGHLVRIAALSVSSFPHFCIVLIMFVQEQSRNDASVLEGFLRKAGMLVSVSPLRELSAFASMLPATAWSKAWKGASVGLRSAAITMNFLGSCRLSCRAVPCDPGRLRSQYLRTTCHKLLHRQHKLCRVDPRSVHSTEPACSGAMNSNDQMHSCRRCVRGCVLKC